MDNHANRPHPKIIVKRVGGGHLEVVGSQTRSFKKGDLVPDGEPVRPDKKAAEPGIASQYKRAAEMCMTTGEGQETISLADAIKSYSEAAEFYEAAGDKKGAAKAYKSLATCMETSGDKVGAARAYVKAAGYFKEIGDETSAVDMRANAVACTVHTDQVEDVRKAPAPAGTAAPQEEKVPTPPTVERKEEAPQITKKMTATQKKMAVLTERVIAKVNEKYGPDPSAKDTLAAARNRYSDAASTYAGDLYTEAASSYRKKRDNLCSAECEYTAGRFYRTAGERGKAAEAFYRAAEMYSKHYDGRKRAPDSEECAVVGHASHHAAESMVEKGKWQTAAELFVTAAAWYERCDEPEMTEKQELFLKWHSCGSSLMMAGRCYTELGWKKQAAEAYGMASEAYRRGGDERHAKEAMAKAHMADGFVAKVLAGLNDFAGFLTGTWARQ